MTKSELIERLASQQSHIPAKAVEDAVKEMLDNTFVTVVTTADTAESRPVKVGEKVGNWYIVESGLAAGDRVVVEGVDKVKQGAQLSVALLSPESI